LVAASKGTDGSAGKEICPVKAPPDLDSAVDSCVSTYRFVAACCVVEGSDARISPPVSVPPARGSTFAAKSLKAYEAVSPVGVTSRLLASTFAIPARPLINWL
jgi:hypothetical protein